VRGKILLSGAAAVILLLSGCGAGGDSDKTIDTALKGIVADGYIKDATVCIDLNNNGVCEDSEPSGKTDNLGRFSINYDGNITGPFVAQGGMDIERNVPFTTVFKAPVKDSVNVTPLVTMAYEYSKENNTTYEDSVRTLANSLGLREDYFEANPEVNNQVKPITVKVQAAVETIVNVTGDQNQSVKLYKELAENLTSANGSTPDEKLSAAVENIPDVPPQAKVGALAMMKKVDELLQNNDFSKYVTVKSTIENTVRTALDHNSTIDENLLLTLVENELKKEEVISENNDTMPALADIENNISLLSVTLSDIKANSQLKTADVEAAKDTIAQIRGLIYEFVDPNVDNQELNTSTIVGNISSNYNNALKPALDDISDELESLNSHITYSLEGFDYETSEDFNNSLTELSNRLDAIADVFESHEENESFGDTQTSYGDTVSHTYSVSGDTVTEVYKLNGKTLTVSYPVDGTYDNAGDIIDNSQVSISGSLTLNDTNGAYSLTLNKLGFSADNRFEFEGSGEINGESNSKIEGDISISFDADTAALKDAKLVSAFQNVSFVINGSVKTHSGKTLEGQFELNDRGVFLNGKYTDSQLVLDGNVTINMADSKWKNYLDDQAVKVQGSYYWGDDSIIKVDGKVVGKIQPSNNGDDKFILTTIDGEQYNCSYDFTDCNGTVAVDQFWGKVVTFNINGKDYVSNDIYYDYHHDDRQILEIDLIMYDKEVYYDDEDGLVVKNLETDTQEKITSFSYTVREPMSADELSGDINFNGNVTDGTVTASMKMALKYNSDDKNAEVYMSNVKLTTSTLNMVSNDMLHVKYDTQDGKVGLVEFKDFNATVKDINGNEAKITNMMVTFNYDDNSEVTSGTTYGELGYLDTSFRGYTNVSLNSDNNSTGVKAYLQVNRTGYEPFILIADATGETDELRQAKFLVVKGDYQLGGEAVTDESEEGNVTLYDTNGVFVTAIGSEHSDIIYLKNSSGDVLGEFNSTVNNWDINYSDGTTETLY